LAKFIRNSQKQTLNSAVTVAYLFSEWGSFSSADDFKLLPVIDDDFHRDDACYDP